MFASKAFLVLLTLACLSNAIECVNFSKCSDSFKFGKLHSIQVSDCTPNDSACPFKTGQKVSMELNYEAAEDFSAARIEIDGILAGIHVPFKLNPDSVCHYGNCPIRANTMNSIKIELPILAIYPRLKLTVQISLIGLNGEKILCVRFPAKIIVK